MAGTWKAGIPPDASNDDNVVETKFSPEASEYTDARGSYLNTRVISDGTLVVTRSYIH